MKHIVGVGLLMIGLVAVAQADIIQLFNTGVDGTGSPLANGTTDSHYSLISVPSGSTVAVAMTSAGGFPVGPWVGDSSISAWISPNNGSGAMQSDPVGNYTFRTTFSLTGLDPSSASIGGRWSTDNGGISILLNGIDTGNIGSPSFSSWTTFNFSSGFHTGLNTLDFVVNNQTGATGNPAGLRVEMSGMAMSAVPEASTWMAGLGAVGMLLVGLRSHTRQTAAARVH